jgi:hypothetical protein
MASYPIDTEAVRQAIRRGLQVLRAESDPAIAVGQRAIAADIGGVLTEILASQAEVIRLLRDLREEARRANDRARKLELLRAVRAAFPNHVWNAAGLIKEARADAYTPAWQRIARAVADVVDLRHKSAPQRLGKQLERWQNLPEEGLYFARVADDHAGAVWQVLVRE